MGLDIVKSGAIILPANSTNNIVLLHSWDFVSVDPADDNVICEVQALDGKAEFRILGSVDEVTYPGTGLGPVGEWGVIHGDIRLTASPGESFSQTYIKHPYMAVLADNNTPNPVAVQAIFYGRDSLGPPVPPPTNPTIAGTWGSATSSTATSRQVTGIFVDPTCKYYVAIANEDDGAVTNVTGMGLTWNWEEEAHNSGECRLTIYRGDGTPSGTGTVTITQNNSPSSAHMVVAVKGANNGSPTVDDDPKTGNGTSVSGVACNTEADGLFLGFIAEDNNLTFTPTGGNTSVLPKYGASSDIALHLVKFAPTVAGTRNIAGNLSSSADWASITMGIRKAP